MDKMQVEILEDGTISISTTEFKDSNHVSADELLDEIEQMAGGTRTTTPNKHESTYWKTHRMLRGGKVVKIGKE